MQSQHHSSIDRSKSPIFIAEQAFFAAIFGGFMLMACGFAAQLNGLMNQDAHAEIAHAASVSAPRS